MGHETLSRTSYNSAVNKHVPTSGPVTRRGVEEVRKTGKLNPLVDPAGFDVIRRSLPRMEKQDISGLYRLTVGIPMPIEIRLDTTGSMGDNVEKAMKNLPDTFGLCSELLPGYDVQMAIGIFGDCDDNFVLCRPQFEMTAAKIVEQLTLMVPEGCGGGNGGEDPQYGLFGAAYLTAAHINRIGLKGYDFTISDEPARIRLRKQQLKRIFGDEVLQRVADNKFEFSEEMLNTEKVVQDLLDRAHAFFLELDSRYSNMHSFWVDLFGPERVVVLPNIELLPYVQAAIIGLTEGTLDLSGVAEFLKENKVNGSDTSRIIRSVSNIPIGAQAILRAKLDRPLPQKGDLFREKTDLWPVNPDEVVTNTTEIGSENNEGPNWL